MDDIKIQALPTAEQQFFAELRSATAASHKALEATSLSARLVDKDVSVTDYATYLAYMRSVISFCEREVFPVIGLLLADIEQRRKLAAIDADLQVLAAKTGSSIAAPVFTAGMPTGDVAFALGYMYVVEGSTLGGRILLNHVKGALGFSEQSGARFFAGYGAGTGPLWKVFLGVLGNYAVTYNCNAQIIEGAQCAFSDIEHHFAQTS